MHDGSSSQDDRMKPVGKALPIRARGASAVSTLAATLSPRAASARKARATQAQSFSFLSPEGLRKALRDRLEYRLDVSVAPLRSFRNADRGVELDGDGAFRSASPCESGAEHGTRVHSSAAFFPIAFPSRRPSQNRSCAIASLGSGRRGRRQSFHLPPLEHLHYTRGPSPILFRP